MPSSFGRWGIAGAGQGQTAFWLRDAGDGSCKEHPAARCGAELPPVSPLENAAAVRNGVCFLQRGSSEG